MIQLLESEVATMQKNFNDNAELMQKKLVHTEGVALAELNQVGQFVGEQQQMIKDLQKEDEGSTIRIQELERMRDLAVSATNHIHNRHEFLANEYQQQLDSTGNAMMEMGSEDNARHVRSEMIRGEACNELKDMEDNW